MIRGLYASASAMVADSLRQDIVANNIANATTTGFNRDCVGFESFPYVLIEACDRGVLLGTITQGSRACGTYIDIRKGPAVETGGPADVFIRGEGFFVAQDGDRAVYTRQGSFAAGPGGLLVTQKGHPVMGIAGPIRTGSGALSVDGRGWVRCGNETVGRLKVVRFSEQAKLAKDEHGYLTPSLGSAPGLAPETVPEPDLEPGALEMSNVNPVMEMVSLITVLRSYEANAKALQAQDETLARAVNDIAR